MGTSTSAVEVFLKSGLVAFTDRNTGFTEDDAASVDDTYFALLHNVGTVDAHETGGR